MNQTKSYSIGLLFTKVFCGFGFMINRCGLQPGIKVSFQVEVKVFFITFWFAKFIKERHEINKRKLIRDFKEAVQKHDDINRVEISTDGDMGIYIVPYKK